MDFEPLSLTGAFIVRSPRPADERGWFQRTFDRDAFKAAGLADCSLQCSLSWNPKRGTLRGMHAQRPPHSETKLVRCLSGSIFDVIVDLRPGSPSLGKWIGVELSADNGQALYIPAGFAHGFLSRDDASLVQYQMAEPFVAGAASGYMWNDPVFAIQWPEAPAIIGARDCDWPPYAATMSAA